MKIKIFTTTEKGKIILSQKDLQDLLNEAYNEGYQDGYETITFPRGTIYNYGDDVSTKPYVTTTTTSNGNITLTAEELKPYSISYQADDPSVTFCTTIGGTNK